MGNELLKVVIGIVIGGAVVYKWLTKPEEPASPSYIPVDWKEQVESEQLPQENTWPSDKSITCKKCKKNVFPKEVTCILFDSHCNWKCPHCGYININDLLIA